MFLKIPAGRGDFQRNRIPRKAGPAGEEVGLQVNLLGALFGALFGEDGVLGQEGVKFRQKLFCGDIFGRKQQRVFRLFDLLRLFLRGGGPSDGDPFGEGGV